jgi:UDP-N-acetylmuramyl tripeptide synthase
VNTVALKWRKTLGSLPKSTTVMLNADDPHVAYLGFGLKAKTTYFGIEDKLLYLTKRPYAMDAVYCPKCSKPLFFEGIYLGHLGNWKCKACGLKRPEANFESKVSILPGVYNMYNGQAAYLVGKTLGFDKERIEKGLRLFIPAFGRQEEFTINGKKIKIFLSKNPTGFNESLRTVKELGAKNVLLILNDRIPDGRDVSWIWDVDFEEFLNGMNIVVGGDRVFDMALRLKHAELLSEAYTDLRYAIKKSLSKVKGNDTLYILATYSAMLETRKILGGRKIL